MGEGRRTAASHVRRIVWTALAVDDLISIRTYIDQFNPSAAAHIAERLVTAADSLEEFADRGRATTERHRELLAIWPYIIRYRIEPERVVILRIRHGHQQRE